jgi:nucleoside-specific outer membrane channel protein Tsx
MLVLSVDGLVADKYLVGRVATICDGRKEFHMKTLRHSAALIAAVALVVVQVTIAGVAGAVSPRTPPIGTQLAELKGADTVAGDDFGLSVAVSESGTTAVLGAPGLFGHYAGRAYVFTKLAGVWKQTAELKGSDTVAGEHFGTSVAIWGTTVVVGATGYASSAGRAYVFTKTAGVWKQTAELKGSDTATGDYFGVSVSISGTTILVGADGLLRNRVYVFTETAGAWEQTAELKGSDTGAADFFGHSVAILGTTVVVGAIGHASLAGRAYVFTKLAGAWKQTAELKGSDTGGIDTFGASVSISGTTILVGADGHASFAGRAYVFTKTAGVWKQTAELKGSDTVANDSFGLGVAISGTTAVVGASGRGKNAGRAYVFTKLAGVWKQTAELGSDTVAGDLFGMGVAISGPTAVVSAYGYAGKAGRTYVFEA